MVDIALQPDGHSYAAIPESHILEAINDRITRGLASFVEHRTVTTLDSLDDVSGRCMADTLYLSTNGYHLDIRYGKVLNAYVVFKRWGTSGDIDAYIYGTTLKDAQEAADMVVKSITVMPIRDHQSPVAFWSWSDISGAVKRTRMLDVCKWDDVITNYPPGPREALDAVVKLKEAPSSGRLILLHGPPGTGKTYAIRTLAHEWQDWCKIHYIVDPERFFGNANYMLSVLIEEEESVDDEFMEIIAPNKGTLKKKKPQWRLIVLEDTDELIRVDSKNDTGQAVSRLLNVCDGLVGQGLRTLFLITTNEKMEKLNPAVVRPGRCAVNIEISPFNKFEAEIWHKEHGFGGEVEKGGTLAELYQNVKMIDGKIESITKRTIGFAR